MSRSPLFRDLRRIIANEALSRRGFLKGVGALTVFTASPVTANIHDIANLTQENVAVIGGGLAGLTAAYYLTKSGLQPVIYEANTRLGGRIYTRYNIGSGTQFAELGAEFIDTNHLFIRRLASELGVDIQKIEDGAGEEIYVFRGKFYRPEEALKAGAPLIKVVVKDSKYAFAENGKLMDYGKKLDKQSLSNYLELNGKGCDPWFVDLVRVAYVTEYGVELNKQSALNLVALFGKNRDFELYGESDEAYRIKGGSSKLIEALQKELEGKVTYKMRHYLAGFEEQGDKVAVRSIMDGHATVATYKAAICTVPFSVLRHIPGMDDMPFSPLKTKAIFSLGYGNSSKVVLPTSNKPWKEKDAFQTRSNGSFFTDLPMQSIWDGSRSQEGQGGMLCNFLGGELAEQSTSQAIANAIKGISSLHEPTAKAIVRNRITGYFWSKNRYTQAGYTAPKPGQWQWIFDEAAKPEFKGKLQFAGEHTSRDYNGYMNGAVESGIRAANAVLEQLQGD